MFQRGEEKEEGQPACPASRGCQIHRAAGKAAGGVGGMLRPLLFALLGEVGEEGAHGRGSPRRRLCSKSRAAKVRLSSPLLLRTHTAALGLLRTSATQSEQRKESSTSSSRSTGIIFTPSPPPAPSFSLSRRDVDGSGKNCTTAASLRFLGVKESIAPVLKVGAAVGFPFFSFFFFFVF